MKKVIFTAKECCELGEINETTFYSRLKKDWPKSEPEEPKGFATIEVIPTLVHARPKLFAEVGNIKLYKAVPAEYFKSTTIMGKILSLAADAKFYLYRKPVKMSWSFDGLVAVIGAQSWIRILLEVMSHFFEQTTN